MTGSIVAWETIIAPSTDSSASRFCGRDDSGFLVRWPTAPLSQQARASASGRTLPPVCIRVRRRNSARRGPLRSAVTRKSQAAARPQRHSARGSIRTDKSGLGSGYFVVGDDRLDRGGDAAADLDLDHVGAGLADRLLEPDLLACRP